MKKYAWDSQSTVWKVKVTQSCPALFYCLDCTVHGILQARILEWITFPFSRGSSQGIEPRSPVLQVECLPLSLEAAVYM